MFCTQDTVFRLILSRGSFLFLLGEVIDWFMLKQMSKQVRWIKRLLDRLNRSICREMMRTLLWCGYYWQVMFRSIRVQRAIHIYKCLLSFTLFLSEKSILGVDISRGNTFLFNKKDQCHISFLLTVRLVKRIYPS